MMRDNMMYMIRGNKRLASESFRDYKERRKKENLICKYYLRGEAVWQGKDIFDWKGGLIVKGLGPYRELCAI